MRLDQANHGAIPVRELVSASILKRDVCDVAHHVSGAAHIGVFGTREDPDFYEVVVGIVVACIDQRAKVQRPACATRRGNRTAHSEAFVRRHIGAKCLDGRGDEREPTIRHTVRDDRFKQFALWHIDPDQELKVFANGDFVCAATCDVPIELAVVQLFRDLDLFGCRGCRVF